MHNFNSHPIKQEFTNWIISNCTDSISITNKLQLLSLDESLEQFLINFPDVKSITYKEFEMKWILNNWILNMTLMLDAQSEDIFKYRSIELSAIRHDEIRQHLLNETRKIVSACYKSNLKFIN